MEVSRRLVDIDHFTRRSTRLPARMPFWFVRPSAQTRARTAMELASRMKR